MRGWVIVSALLAAGPWAGCLGDAPASIGLFGLEPKERGDPTPRPASSCGDLLDTLRDRALDQSRVYLEQSLDGGGWGVADDFAVAAAADESSSAGSRPTSAGPHSARAADAQVTGTNNQEAGADEADLLKTDGEWTYVLSRGTLQVMHSETVGDLAVHSTVDLGGGHGGDLLLAARDPDDPSDDRLVAILPDRYGPDVFPVDASDAAVAEMQGATRILVLSLADRSEPEVLQETWVQGRPTGARLVGGTAYLVVQAEEAGLPLITHAYPTEADLANLGLDADGYGDLPELARRQVHTQVAFKADAANRRTLDATDLDDHLPRVVEVEPLAPSRGAAATLEPLSKEACASVLATPDATGRAVTTILALDVASEEVASSTTQVVAGSSTVYASGDALVLAAPSQDLWWLQQQADLPESTDLHWFDLDGLRVTPRASGRALGTVLDPFSLDVHEDELRVVTTTGLRTWLNEAMVSHVAVFAPVAGQLVPKGVVGGIAPGERIWSARFTDERAYLITFEVVRTDPLWVVDLAGGVPTILGELEIPGVSTYLHPIGDDALLAVGRAGGEGGIGMDEGTVQVSLFDVSDPTQPRRAALLDVGPPEGWVQSAAIDEHKAFTYWPALGTLAVPFTAHSPGWESSHAGIALVEVDPEGDVLRLRGQLDQDILAGLSRGEPAVERTYFLGTPGTSDVSVYAMSQAGMTAHDLDTLRLQGFVFFGG